MRLFYVETLTLPSNDLVSGSVTPNTINNPGPSKMQSNELEITDDGYKTGEEDNYYTYRGALGSNVFKALIAAEIAESQN